MKYWLSVVLFCCIAGHSGAQSSAFRFAFITDTHVGSPDGSAEEDLRHTVRDINRRDDIAFVVLTGDITEMGTDKELALAKRILDSLDVPWYIIPGNHDTGWSESGGLSFLKVFGADRFSFEYGGIRFIGCASGPYVRMSDGHVPRDAVNWLDGELKKINPGQPLVFLNHYPLDEGLDNWYEVTDRIRRYNTQAALCGHGHANKAMDFEGIPGVMGRSNLRAKADEGGYNLVEVTADSLLFTVRRPVSGTEKKWHGVKREDRYYAANNSFKRPDYSVNTKYASVREAWTLASPANVISTPAVSGQLFFVGNQSGVMNAYRLKSGKPTWSFATGGPIYSSPAISGNRLVFGSADGKVYCLDTKKGKALWQLNTDAAVLGCPLVKDDTVFIGGSDGKFRAIDLQSGKEIWAFEGLGGPMVSTPVYHQGKIIFGAWDRHLYALGSRDGSLSWKWNNGSAIRNFSPAACIPVISEGVIYIVAPDRYISAIDAEKGTTLWRNNDATIRESIGMSADGKWIYGKTMQDTVVAYAASREKQNVSWKLACGFGYEHVPSMLIEKEGRVFFGTKSGVVYCIDPQERKIIWAHKLDNSMVNTVRVLDKRQVLVTTMDGKIGLLQTD